MIAMLRVRDAALCGLLFWAHATAAPPNAAGDAGNSRAAGSRSVDADGRRKLTGRFLHITDFHPDPFYKTYSSTEADAACHRKRGPAGLYGAETTGCDSPFALVNQTFKWIEDNIKDDVDFVIWTGDSARHDNDDEIPRTQKQVVQQNEYMVSKFAEVFGQSGHGHGPNSFAIPIVPTYGNNDILPHNIFESGPNRWTTEYLDIWRGFIPEAQRHQFAQGGWFSVEVIPGKLAAISLNTLYFFTSNSAVDGCAKKREPGYEHMEWLRIQLQILRDRGMKAILIGHVPPARVDSKESWDETCWQKYTLFGRQFRDVIVGSLFGHMNIDHFMLQDFEHIEKDTENGKMGTFEGRSALANEIELLEDGEVTVASASDYLLNLREAWAQLPAPPPKSDKKSRSKSFDDEEGEEESMWEWLMAMVGKSPKDRKEERKKYLEKIGGKYAERYAVTHVSPSVVPNYFPTLRIIEYNITGLEHLSVASSPISPPTMHNAVEQLPISANDYSDDDDEEHLQEVETTRKKHHKGKKDKKKPRKYKFKVPDGPSKSSPPGPAYSPQTLTWTRHIQYFANLTHINNDFLESSPDAAHTPVNDRLSINNESVSTIFGFGVSPDGGIENKKWNEGKHKKHQGKQPRPEPHPNEFVFEVEYDTKKDRGFKDLTVRRWVEYARKIGASTGKTKDVGVEEEVEEEAEEAEDVEDEVDEDDFVIVKHKKHKHKKGKKGKHHKKHKASKEWFTFVKRAFVGTMDPKELKLVFGAADVDALEEAQEVMEL
ncbi:Metallo-dependent phosphatase-like protein [Alternaria rosae]|uniref:Metallo-dependent phosphatase-like protein n=1 Tax=Alternaria rosae TaxID=1187941 RepID=UPI001E8D1538|nr:Metallo-dependent phosphatase-like protein [Alternaria rosae]KAH6861091.1 Metallo-dependent phosphatase-like protein [Alternaria rosae]